MTYRVRNVSKVRRTIQLGYTTDLWVILRSPDGERYDTDHPEVVARDRRRH